MAALFISILTIANITSNSKSDIVIETVGNTFFSSNFLITKYKSIKRHRDLEKFIKAILDTYGDAGFPFCSIRPEFIDVDSTTTKLILNISEGERIIIKDYLLKTDGKTDIAPLRRIAHIRKNQYFSLENLNQTKRAILKTNAFSSISESIVKNGDDYYLVFDLNEKSSDYLAVTGSFAEANNYFMIDLNSLNFFGTLRQFRFCYEANIALQTSKRLFKINFIEPVILNPVTFHSELSLWTYDSARFTELNGRFVAPLNNNISMVLSSGIEMTNYLSDTGNYSNTHTLLGTGVQTEYEMNNITLENSITLDYLFRKEKRWRIRYDGVIEFAKFFVKPHCLIVETEKFQYFDYIRLGGADNLRGYMEDEFLVKKAWWLNLEYKILPIYPILDIAWLDRDYTYSYGAGIDAQTNFANVSIAFAWPEKGKWTDGKIHFLFKKGF
ncbi:MAG: hypothetical protein ACPL28_10385 [bacterium]